MAFPYDCGFVPSTVGDDGDPLDVLLLTNEPALAGCRLICRRIGAIQGEQSENKRTGRNDRVIALERANHSYAHVKHVDDLGKRFARELEQLLVNYHELDGKELPYPRP